MAHYLNVELLLHSLSEKITNVEFEGDDSLFTLKA